MQPVDQCSCVERFETSSRTTRYRQRTSVSNPSSYAPAAPPPGPTAPDPAPLGLIAFSMANIIQSFFNAGINLPLFPAAFPLGFFVGGLVQMIAGIFEFRQGSRLGATAFTVLGAFWLCFVAYAKSIVAIFPRNRPTRGGPVSAAVGTDPPRPHACDLVGGGGES
ncbi:acetate uptake transporter [Streptomyces sp. NPDC048295]|uniref:acetate uptake transporter n=1 Tax=Streptomyces sp. NPDC048295 TaxID=3154617 RepID=UPI003444DDFA